MSDYPMLISNKLHSFRNFLGYKDTTFLIENKKSTARYLHRRRAAQTTNTNTTKQSFSLR